MNIGEKIKKARLDKGLTQKEIAQKIGISQPTYTQWENGTRNPKMGTLKKISEALEVPINILTNDFLNDDGIPKNVYSIPLYTSISCGTGLFVDDEIEDYIAIPNKLINPHKEYFANTATGDSMIGRNIKDGDILIFEKTTLLENGQVGSFCIDNQNAVCKIFRKLENGMILLESANKKYEPLIIDIESECFRIIGKLIAKFECKI